MPFLPFSQALTANGTYEPLSGWQYEYIPWPAYIEIAFRASAASQAVATVTSGSDTLAEEGPVTGGGTAGVLPDLDKPFLEDVAAPGDRLKIRFRETAGATPTIDGWVRITRLG